MKKVAKKIAKRSRIRFGGIAAVAILFGLVGFVIARQVGSDRASISATAECPVDVCVALQSEAAVPDTVAINVGQSIQFNSADGQTHSLSQGLGGEEHSHTGPYSSGDFAGDEAWRVQFKQPGTFKFHDHYNPDVNILVVAYEPDAVKPLE